MKTQALMLALALTGVSAGAQAATWTLGDTTLGGLRVGAVSFDGLPAAVEIGNLTDDYNASGLDWRAAGSWRSLTASLGGNSIDLHMTHEAYVDAAQLLDPYTASVRLVTTAGLDNAVITTPMTLGAVALAPASVVQDFVIVPEVGETLGQAVMVNFAAYYDHDIAGSGFTPYLSSNYRLFLNGSEIDAGLATGVGSGAGSWMFAANIGDTLRIEAFNTAQLGIAGMLLAAGAHPEAWALGEAGAYLTLSPIPEPETWAMLLTGLGLVGLQLRRKPRIHKKLEI